MEPAAVRAVLARTPGLTVRHLDPLAETGLGLGPELVPALLARPLPHRTRAWLQAPRRCLIDSDLRSIEENRCQILCSLDPGFPSALAALPDAPATVYLRGDAAALARPVLAIAGAAVPSPAGTDVARAFAARLAQAGLGIATGLAEGIGSAAQAGAARTGGGCIAVAITGLDRIRSASSARLAAEAAAAGCVISPFPPGTPPQRYHFAIRHRLLAALSVGVLLIEADARGGALGVAARAQALRRPVFAVPGSIRDPHARACNLLIRGGATLVQEPAEILADLNLTDIQGLAAVRAAPDPGPPLDNKYEMLLDAAGFEPVDIDELALRTGWPVPVLTSMLLLLELQGRVAPQPGGRYCRLS
ncbi:MAG TPA: DNA-processing protein DprA [Steroidobacteraceae bacterium]|nr:DNA-processing protein DprA [Steroidobacteraceae bacterium]